MIKDAENRDGASRVRIRHHLKRVKAHAIFGSIFLAIILLFLWPRIVVSVKPGQAGVLYSRFLGGTVEGTVYGEGVHFILPWDIMYIYDVRLQEYSSNLSVLTKDGLSVDVSASIRYHPIRDVLPQLHKFVGPDYRRKLVHPIFVSSVRETVGEYRPEDLYTTARQQIQDEILVEAVEEMGRIPIAVDSVIIKRITLPATINRAIEQKLAEEQAYLRYRYILLRTKEEVKRQVMLALGMERVQELVNKGLTDNYLRLKGVEATTKLAQSPNTKIVIVGGKDGLPIILNPEAPMSKSPTKAQKAPPAKAAPSAKAGTPPPSSEPKAKEAAAGFDWKKLWRELTGIDALLSRVISQSEPAKFEKGLLAPRTMAPMGPPPPGGKGRPGVWPPGLDEFPGPIYRSGPGSYPVPPPPRGSYNPGDGSLGSAPPVEKSR